jgi:PAS domain-containing protein
LKSGIAGAVSLADAFLSAPFEACGWDVALRRLATETRSLRAELIAFGGPSTIPLDWMTDPVAGFTEELASIEGGSPAVNWRVACAGAPLELAWESHYEEARKRLRSDVYDEFAERHEMQHGCQAVLAQTPDVFYGLAALRSRGDRPTTEADREVFAGAAPHVLTAIKLQQALEHQGAAMVAGAFEAMNAAAFVCDRSGQVQALTRAAERKLHEPLGLRLSRNRLLADRPADDRALQSALRRVLDHSTPAPGGIQFWLQPGPAGLPAHRCECCPCRGRTGRSASSRGLS